MSELWGGGGRICLFPLTRLIGVIAYTTACSYRTSRDGCYCCSLFTRRHNDNGTVVRSGHLPKCSLHSLPKSLWVYEFMAIMGKEWSDLLYDVTDGVLVGMGLFVELRTGIIVVSISRCRDVLCCRQRWMWMPKMKLSDGHNLYDTSERFLRRSLALLTFARKYAQVTCTRQVWQTWKLKTR